MLKEVGLEKRIYHRVTKLSGGEKQRVSIARALCSDAPIIACDEITGNLDMATSIEVIELLKRLSKGKLVLLVSHDVNEAIDYATRVIIMHDGSVDKDYPVNENNDICEECLHKEVEQKLLVMPKKEKAVLDEILIPNKSKGTLSLIFGILGLTTINIIFSIIALSFSKKSKNTLGYRNGEIGKTLAVIGIIIQIILYALAIVFGIIFVILFILNNGLSK